MRIRDRVVELRRVPASALRPNPKNWRGHPESQKDAIRGVLADKLSIESDTTDEFETAWRFNKPSRNPDHPTMKPLSLCARAIRHGSRKGEIVLDGFLGSGSTLIASEQLGRVCYGTELDPRYCDVIVARWETLTGLEACLEKSATSE